METQTLDQRQKFIDTLESGHWSMIELCARFGVSRPTGYKWVTRYRAGGRAALADRSHAPHHCPHRTGDPQEALILAVRRGSMGGAPRNCWRCCSAAIPPSSGPRAVRSMTCWRASSCCRGTGADGPGPTRAARH